MPALIRVIQEALINVLGELIGITAIRADAEGIVLPFRSIEHKR